MPASHSHLRSRSQTYVHDSRRPAVERFSEGQSQQALAANCYLAEMQTNVMMALMAQLRLHLLLLLSPLPLH